MKYSLIFSIFFVLIFLTKESEAQLGTPEDDFQGTNNVEDDYIKEKTNDTSAVSSGDGTESTWIWQPKGNQKNKVKFESVVGHFDDNEESSGRNGDVLEQTIDDEDNRETPSAGNWSNWESIKVKTTAETPNDKKQSIDEKRYLTYEKHLQKTNWCFKENEKVHQQHKFKKTGVCCRKRKQCRTTRHAKRGIYQCSCDVNFYMCLKKANTKMSNSIKELYFNRNKIACYKKVIRKPCTTSCNVQYKWKIIEQFS